MARAAITASTSVSITDSCGNDIKEGTEWCDGNDFGGKTCASYPDIHNFNLPFQSGTLYCTSHNPPVLVNSILTYDCSGDNHGSRCYTCGNNFKEANEECDGNPAYTTTNDAAYVASFGTSTCGYYGYATGTISCSNACRIVSHCSQPLTDTGTSNTQGGGAGGGGSSGGGGSGGGAGGGAAGLATGNDPGSLNPPVPARLVVNGKAYPNVEVQILIDGSNYASVKTDATGSFKFETDKVTPGVINLGLKAKDSKGRDSIVQNITFRVSSAAVTTVSGAYLAPTIQLDKTTASVGEFITISGQTLPNARVIISIRSNSELLKYASSTSLGDWQYTLDTKGFVNDASHLTKAMFSMMTTEGEIKSGYSKALSFYLGKNAGTIGVCAGADLNKDGKVNLIDFSILLYYWGTDNACADQNHNGKVDLTDFSILLYNWNP